jgi:hypothetical protein
MKIIFVFIFLLNGQTEKVPTILFEGQKCQDKFMEIVITNKIKSRVLYKNHIVWAHYCKSIKGEWVQ